MQTSQNENNDEALVLQDLNTIIPELIKLEAGFGNIKRIEAIHTEFNQKWQDKFSLVYHIDRNAAKGTYVVTNQQGQEIYNKQVLLKKYEGGPDGVIDWPLPPTSQITNNLNTLWYNRRPQAAVAAVTIGLGMVAAMKYLGK